MTNTETTRITNIPPRIEWMPQASEAFKSAFGMDIMDDADGSAWYFYGVGIDRDGIGKPPYVSFVYCNAGRGTKWRSCRAPVSFYEQTSGYVRCGRCERAVQWEQDESGVYLDCLACGRCKTLLPTTLRHIADHIDSRRDLGDIAQERFERSLETGR